MYLTKLDIDVLNPNANRLLGNAHALHSVLCRASGASRQESGLLHRVINEPHRHAVYTYSTDPLDLEALPEGLHERGTKNLSPWILDLSRGKTLRYDVVAVPSKNSKYEFP